MNDQSSGQSPAQGWYTDPHDASKLRWWDGAAWTGHIHSPAGEVAAAAPAAQAETEPTAATATAAATTAPAPTTPASSTGGAGGIVSNPAPKAGAASSGGEKGVVAQWFSVRSNQILFVVLLIAIVLFIFVMAGGAS